MALVLDRVHPQGGHPVLGAGGNDGVRGGLLAVVVVGLIKPASLATAGEVEYAIKIKNNSNVVLSTQHLVDCTYN